MTVSASRILRSSTPIFKPEPCGSVSTRSSFPIRRRQQILNGHRGRHYAARVFRRYRRKRQRRAQGIRRARGTLILLNHASDLGAQDLGVKAKNTLDSPATLDFYSPGSLLNVTLNTSSPLAYGMPSRITLWSEQSPAWDAPDSDVVARYPSDHVLASGWLLGEKYLAGKAALLDVPMGRGESFSSECALNIAARVTRISSYFLTRWFTTNHQYPANGESGWLNVTVGGLAAGEAPAHAQRNRRQGPPPTPRTVWKRPREVSPDSVRPHADYQKGDLLELNRRSRRGHR